jgi:DNA-binding response OmpR family regulator
MSKLKILVVEDDRDIAKILKYNLEKEGYQALVAQDGEEGVASFRREKPRLVILDLMLPIRAEDKKTPVLMVTAKSSEVDKIVGLEMGADDYVTKPFSVREVMTRVKTLLRRTTGEDAPSDVLSAGVLELDPAQYELRLQGKPLVVTGREFELLKSLWTARGKVLSREELLERVWGIDKAADIDTRTVDQHVARLRAKLGPEKKRLRTVKGVGYRFTGE